MENENQNWTSNGFFNIHIQLSNLITLIYIYNFKMLTITLHSYKQYKDDTMGREIMTTPWLVHRKLHTTFNKYLKIAHRSTYLIPGFTVMFAP